MKRTKKLITTVMLMAHLACALVIFSNDVSANEVESLKQQIEMLKKRVVELEEEKESSDHDKFIKDNRVWSPFEEIYRMQEEMERMFEHSLKSRRGIHRGLFSSDMSYDDDFEIKDKKDKYIIEIDMKGVDKKQLEVEINEQTLTIKGERTVEEIKDSKGSYFKSQSFSSFMKTIPLPTDADTSEVKSEKKGEKLVITLPKK